MHLFLSPHADDAALSCGGQIAQLTRAGQRVVIFTVMAGDPPAGFQDSTFAEELRERWSLGQSPVVGRREEDREAAFVLGAEIEFGVYPDAVFRAHPDTGKALYPDDPSIWGPIHPDDPVSRTAQAESFDLHPDDVIHAPLGVGHHVDHQLVRDMALMIAEIHPENEIFFYEEYPYRRKGEAVIHAAIEALEAAVIPVLQPVDPQASEVRIAAVACYKSQLSSFEWDSPEAMFETMRGEIAESGGEREWHLVRSSDDEDGERRA